MNLRLTARSTLGPALRLRSFAVGVVLAALVVYPVAGRGWLLILDWVNGPGTVFPPGVFGLALPATPFPILLRLITFVIGSSTASWLLLAGFFPLAVVSFARLFEHQRVASIAGSILFALNPFVFERIGAGQIPFLIGYALLPMVLASLRKSRRAGGLRSIIPAAWVGLATACSIHYLWISGVLLIGVVVADRRSGRLRWFAANLVADVVVNLYLILPSWSGTAHVAVGAADLNAYRTASDPTFGLGINVLGLYGFWRTGPRLPKDDLSGWVVLLAAILLVAGIGAANGWRRERSLVLVCGIAGMLGFLLSLGDQGPTAWFYRRLFFDVPGFAVMRESEKFSALVALSLSVLFALGAERLLASASGVAVRRITAVLVVGLPFAYTPTMFDGLGGQLAAVHYPKAWYQAKAAIGRGEGAVLFLPWHQYMSFSFTRGIIGTPANVFFDRQVISGDNVELAGLETDSTSPRSAYLQRLYAAGPSLTEFGHLVAQLGVSYVVLSHNVDFRSYDWLYHQRDLRQIMRDGSLTVWKNLAAVPAGTRVASLVAVSSQQEYIDLAQLGDLTGTAVVIRPSDPTPGLHAGPAPLGELHQSSQTRFEASAGAPGWIVLPEDANSGWRGPQGPSVALADGAIAVRATSAAASVSFQPWTLVLVGYCVAAFGMLFLLFVSIVERRKTGTPAPPPPPAGLSSER